MRWGRNSFRLLAVTPAGVLEAVEHGDLIPPRIGRRFSIEVRFFKLHVISKNGVVERQSSSFSTSCITAAGGGWLDRLGHAGDAKRELAGRTGSCFSLLRAEPRA